MDSQTESKRDELFDQLLRNIDKQIEMDSKIKILMESLVEDISKSTKSHLVEEKVLEIRDDKAWVVNPLRCIYGCSACASLCPKDAIVFPSKGTILNSTTKGSLLHRVVCRGCVKRFSADRDVEYCFDCENKVEAKGQTTE